MIPTVLVVGGNAAAREAAIASALDPTLATALILEGLPDGASRFESLSLPRLQIARIAPGCPCCTGNLTMRVTLNRLLRRSPERLYIGLASAAHLEQVRAFLTEPPYGNMLQLAQELHV